MACLLVPAAEAVVTTIATKAMESYEKSQGTSQETVEKIPFSRKMKWLNKLLWGGSALLAFEHVWHGEITPWFPFLTAVNNPVDMAQMLSEMATSGVAMAAIVTVVWLGMVAVTSMMEKDVLEAQPSKTKGV